MALVVLIVVSVALSLWFAPRRNRVPSAPVREPDLTGPRSRYLADEIEIEEFEGQVAEALERPPRSRPPETPVPTVHTEIHVWGDPPPGHQLHIHLP